MEFGKTTEKPAGTNKGEMMMKRVAPCVITRRVATGDWNQARVLHCPLLFQLSLKEVVMFWGKLTMSSALTRQL